MQLKIKFIILYPKDKSKHPRCIKFNENKVNVITGFSQRGKSAIISILDYCLASSDCNIPVGLIRNKVAVFALFISIKEKNYFLARECPGMGIDVSDKMYLYEIKEKGEKPIFNYNDWLNEADEYRYNREYVKNFLSVEAGFSNIPIGNDPTNNGFDGELSFRDSVAFVFQPQNIIANPTTIFYKTETYAHLKRLKILFPLALGYKSFEMISLEREIEEAEKEIRDLQKKFDDIQYQYSQWQSDIYEYYTYAITLGLTQADFDIKSTNIEVLKLELQKIISVVKRGNYFKEGSSLRYGEKLEELDKKRIIVTRELNGLKIDYNKLLQFDRTKEEYINNVLQEVDKRLTPIEYFLQLNGTDSCPFCRSKTSKAVNELLLLKTEHDKIKPILEESSNIRYSFEKEKINLRKRIKDKENELVEINKNIQILLNENLRIHEQYRDIFEFIGKIENVLFNLDKITPNSVLSLTLGKLNEDLARKKNDLINKRKQFDKETALNKVTSCIGKYIKKLPIEDKEYTSVVFDPDDSLNIKIKNSKNNTITFLSRIGSGANHMCYHIATFLGLHEYFQILVDQGKNNFVPSLLIIDQPSQVYYPNAITTKKELARSQDWINTSKIFEACSEFLRSTNGKTQIIVLEHAPENVWKKFENIEIADKQAWGGDDPNDRQYRALIPKEWLQDEEY